MKTEEILTDPSDYFVYHVKTIKIFQVFTDMKYVHQLFEKILLHYQKLSVKILVLVNPI